MDLLIFSGQSNMQGQTECPTNDKDIQRAVEYKLLTNSFVPLNNPVGEDIGELLLGSHLGHGSLVPYFCDSYIKTCDKDVIAVHTAKGATVVQQWVKEDELGNERYLKAVEKINGAINLYGKDFEKKYFIWLQGESDALAKTTGEDYKKMLISVKNNLKKDLGIDKFCIIEVGYFASNFGGQADDEIIQKTQRDLCEEDEDFVMLTDLAKKLSLEQVNINPDAVGHFNNAAMKKIGDAAGSALAKMRG